MIPFVYLAIATDGTHKIGWTRSPTGRMQTLASEAAQGVQLLHHVQTEHATWIEGYLHRLFDKKRLHGEWFLLDDEDVAHVCELTPESIAMLRTQNPDADASNGKAIKIAPDLANKIKLIIAADMGHTTMQGYINSVLRPIVEKLYRDMVRKMNAELDEDS